MVQTSGTRHNYWRSLCLHEIKLRPLFLALKIIFKCFKIFGHTEGSDSAYKHLSHYEYKFSSANAEEAIHFFYKNSDSFQVEEPSGKLNFNGRKVFAYIHGGYWQWGRLIFDWLPYFWPILSKEIFVIYLRIFFKAYSHRALWRRILLKKTL